MSSPTTSSRVPAGVPTGGQFSASAKTEAGLHLDAPTADTVLGDPPLATFDEVSHVGTLNSADREPWSYEGEGLSVSVDPDDWATIARLGGPTWRLSRLDGAPLRLVSWHDLDDETRDRVRSWGVNHGWVEQQTVYRVTYMGMDDNGDDVLSSFECPTAEEAEAEADGLDVDPDDEHTDFAVTQAWRPTSSFPDQRLARDSDPTDVLLAHYIREQRPDLDGVWWADEYQPTLLSCPRGVLVHSLDGYSRETDAPTGSREVSDYPPGTPADNTDLYRTRPPGVWFDVDDEQVLTGADGSLARIWPEEDGGWTCYVMRPDFATSSLTLDTVDEAKERAGTILSD